MTGTISQMKRYDLDHANLNGRLDPRPTGHRFRTLGPEGDVTFHRTREDCDRVASELCDELKATVLVEEYARGPSGYWLWSCIGGFAIVARRATGASCGLVRTS